MEVHAKVRAEVQTMNPYDPTQTGAPMDFFQSMLKGSGVPSSFASWMAPTVDADEIERKIIDLRAVLQWLEANVRLTQATIQALEVQRMTLSTLKTMNVDLGALATQMGEAMRAGAEAMGSAASGAAEAAAQQRDEAAPRAGAGRAARSGSRAEPEAGSKPAVGSGARPAGTAEAAPLAGLIDPVQWWNSLGGQFAKVAAEAMREGPWPTPGADVRAAAGSPAAAAAKPAKPARKRPRAGTTGR